MRPAQTRGHGSRDALLKHIGRVRGRKGNGEGILRRQRGREGPAVVCVLRRGPSRHDAGQPSKGLPAMVWSAAPVAVP